MYDMCLQLGHICIKQTFVHYFQLLAPELFGFGEYKVMGVNVIAAYVNIVVSFAML